MKKMKSLISLKSLKSLTAVTAAATAFLAACTSPDGDLPAALITFASQMDAPQTRASADNAWDGSETVRVSIDGDVHNFAASADGTLTPAPPLYYETQTAVSASAWYPAAYTFPADQSAGVQAADFVFAAEVQGITASNYATRPLTFTHRTAKTVVNLTAGDGVSSADLTSATVAIYGYATAAAIDTLATTPTGDITGSGTAWITPYRSGNACTALLLPRAYTSEVFIKITLGADDYFHIPAAPLTLEAGKQYTFAVTVNRNGLTVASGAPTATWTNGGTEALTGQYEAGVVIAGTTWATRNVDLPGTFAETPEAAGMFYQWNRKVGYSATDPMINSNGESTWNNTKPEGTEWEEINDPCPAGWRVPTMDELQSLINSGYQWTTQSSVSGTLFGTAPNTVFLPAVGYRSGIYAVRLGVGRFEYVFTDDFTLLYNNPPDLGNYWTKDIDTMDRNVVTGEKDLIRVIYFYNLVGTPFYVTGSNRERWDGLSVRCVKKNDNE